MINNFNMDMAKSEANKKDIFGRIGDIGTRTYKGLDNFGDTNNIQLGW